MKTGTLWFEDETLWEATYRFMFAEERFATAEAEMAELPKLTGSPFHRVLDLCCGPGSLKNLLELGQPVETLTKLPGWKVSDLAVAQTQPEPAR
jgi:trans-aconitate methyltransferase